MSDDTLFHELDSYLQTVAQHLAVNQRRRLSRQVAAGLRQRQQARINRQQNPDGSSYTERRRQTRRTQGGVRFIWNDEVRELRNWHSSKGRSGDRMITGFDVERGALRSFLRADIDRFISISLNNVTQTRQRKVKMFRKLRTARFLRINASPNVATVGYSGQAANIASIHQHGETENIGHSSIRYPARELLGLTVADLDWLADSVVDFIQPE